jgi:hypothetical protein
VATKARAAPTTKFVAPALWLTHSLDGGTVTAVTNATMAAAGTAAKFFDIARLQNLDFELDHVSLPRQRGP